MSEKRRAAMKKQRWIDTLDIPDRSCSEAQHRYASLDWLNSALYYAEVGDLPMMHSCLTSAGGRIVSWRRSLDDQGRKYRGEYGALLRTQAMWIASCIRMISYDTTQHDLRWVEAVLRSIWKESQREIEEER